jgi:hypothetical protein
MKRFAVNVYYYSIKASLFSVLIAFLIFINKPVFAQLNDSTAGSFTLSAQVHYGFLMIHRPSMIGLVTGHTVGGEIDLTKVANGHTVFERAYHYPEVGLAYCYFALGNPDVLGNAQALYPFVNFPLVRNKKLQLGLRIGGGIGYINKAFDARENFKNNAISSHINGVMSLRFGLDYKLSSKSKLTLALGLTHWSNGSTVVPNLGINVNTVSLSYQHFFGKKTKYNYDSLPGFKSCWKNSFFVAAFHKQIVPSGGGNYLVGTIYGNRAYQFNRKSSLGYGVDVFYNKAIIESLNRQDLSPAAIDAWRAGVHLSYLLSMEGCTITIENGVYVFGKLDGDTWLYTRLGVRQKLSNHVFACVNLKTHYAKADFFEFGVGYEF